MSEKSTKNPYGIRRHVLLAAWTIGLLGAGIGGWAATAELTGAVIAPGSVVVDKHAKRLQHRDGGIVAKIHVENGDYVEAGQVLIEIDETQIRAELGVLQAELTELTARTARLSAVIEGESELEFPAGFAESGPLAADAAAAEQRLFDDAIHHMDRQREQLELQISQLQEEISGLEAQREAKESQRDIIHKELSEVESLFEKQLTSVTRVYALQRESERLNGEHGSLVAQIARSKGKVSEIRLQILAIDQTSRLEAQREMRTGQARMAELREREIAAQDRLTRCRMLAPQAGMVHELTVNTIGGVITEAETVLSIVPSDEDLTIEARVAPVDVDQVFIGREARLRFSAFNQRTTPEVRAKVKHVSADVSIDQNTSQSYYLAKLQLDDEALAELQGLELMPGMPVEVFIETGSRTALSYIVKPVTDQFERAFRGD